MNQLKHIAIAAFLLLTVSASSASAQPKRYYDTSIDPIAQIDAAVFKARTEGKNVVCQVGGDWCRWCIMFAKFVEADKEISQVINDNFVYIHVNYDRKGNPNSAKISDRLGNPGRMGFPCFAVLDSYGKVIHLQDSSFLEEGEGYSREKMLRFFNAWTPKAAAAKPYKVGFMGDSITDNWDDASFHPEFFSENGYLNVGHSGETTSDMLARFRTDILDKHPGILVLCAGTNDIAENDGYHETDEQILGNLKAMCDMARAEGMKVLLCSIPPCNRYLWRPEMRPGARIAALNKKIKALVESEKYDGYVDYFTPLTEDGINMNPKYTNDGCHPTMAGYVVMESIIQAAIAAVTK